MWSRRELLSSVLGAPFAGRLLLGCDDGDPPVAAGVAGEMLGPDMEGGHRLHSGDLPSEEEWDRAPSVRLAVAVLGGGPSGLAAAWRLVRRGREDFEVLELEGEPGGTSVGGASEVTRYPWGAHYLPVPMPHNRDLIALLGELGALEGSDARGLPRGAEHLLVREPSERLFHRGFWYEGLYLHAGASRQDRTELRRFRAELDRLVAMRDGAGRRAFALPLALGSDDPEVMALDGISAEEWLRRQGYRSERLRWLLGYGCRDDYGLELAQTSAFAALWYYAARIFVPGEDTMDLLAWPEGNAALVRHLAGAAGDRVRTRQLVVDVAQDEARVTVRSIDLATGRPRVLHADRVISALPRFVARRVVDPLRDLPDPGLEHGAWMVANLHLRGRPADRGCPPSWDNVLYDSPSLGYVTATHQRGRDFGPTVWTYYLPLTDADAAAGRRRLLEPSWEGWREIVVRDLSRAHPDLEHHLERLDVWRWGHAMAQPRVGFLSSLRRRRAAEPIGRISFAHTDLSGIALFEEAFFHGVRAADEALSALEGATGPAGAVAT